MLCTQQTKLAFFETMLDIPALAFHMFTGLLHCHAAPRQCLAEVILLATLSATARVDPSAIQIVPGSNGHVLCAGLLELTY